MTSAVIVEILLALLTGVVGTVSYLAATRANREQARAATVAVDAAAYSRAREIYEGALSTLRAEVESMRLEIIRLRKANEGMQAEITLLHKEIASMRGGHANGRG